MKIGFIGAGKVGFSLGKYFKDNNLTVTGYYSRNADSAYEAASFTGTKAYKDIENIVYESDAIFITTTDSEISNVWDQIKELSIQNKMICHCSGSLSSKIFSNINESQSFGYSIHPILAISDKYNSYKDLKNSFFTIEGDEKHINQLQDMIAALGNKVERISTEKKELYHCSTVVVSNLVVGLINNGVKQLEECGFSAEDSLTALMPLIECNINNIKQKGLVNALTGPLERGDLITIKKHCDNLNNDDLIIYKSLSKEVLKVAKKKNINRDYKNIEEFIGEKI